MSTAAIDGYLACPANSAFDDWMDKVERQQEILDRK